MIAKNTDNPEWIKSLLHYYKDDTSVLGKGAVSDHCHNVMLLNSFMHDGPNGRHFIMVFEILGVNLLEIMKRYDFKGVPIPRKKSCKADSGWVGLFAQNLQDYSH